MHSAHTTDPGHAGVPMVNWTRLIQIALLFVGMSLSLYAERVTLFVTPSDGVSVAGLTEDGLTVFENGVRRNVLNAQSEGESPMRVVVAVDSSGSGSDWLTAAKQESASFLRTNVRKGIDQAAVVAFGSSVVMMQNFTDDVNALATSFDRIKAGGGTALYDSIELLSGRLASQTGRRVLIVITDGRDNASRHTAEV